MVDLSFIAGLCPLGRRIKSIFSLPRFPNIGRTIIKVRVYVRTKRTQYLMVATERFFLAENSGAL